MPTGLLPDDARVIPAVMIEVLQSEPTDTDMRALAELLVDAVESGASVSFMPPLTLEQAASWWRGTLAGAHPKAMCLVARDEAGIVGSVQLHPAWAPNQPHRAEVAKLLVHRRARRSGVGTRLMYELERHAKSSGFTLLTLDTKRGDAAEALYRREGWTFAGIIPGYALEPSGNAADTVLFYKRFEAPPPA
jgi:GNAT superfamily N-acetyltransferase